MVEKSQNHELLKNLKVYVATDNTVFKEDIYELCKITKEIKGNASFDSLINLDEYSIIDPNELLSNNPYRQPIQSYNILSECDNIHVENELKSPSRNPKFWRRSSSVPSLTYSTWTPVLILIPLKLGSEKSNPLYSSCLKSFLATDTCLGIMGGKPKHSLYFVGFQVSWNPFVTLTDSDNLNQQFRSEGIYIFQRPIVIKSSAKIIEVDNFIG